MRMSRPFFRSFLCALPLLPACLVVLAAQTGGGRPEDNVLFPQPDPLPIFVGVEGGYGWWGGNASFTVNDISVPCVSFSVGDGQGPVFAAKGIYTLRPHILFIPRIRYEVRNSSYRTLLAEEPTRNHADSIVMLRQEAQVDASLAALVGEIGAGWEILGTGAYLFGGVGYNIQLGGSYDYSERILGPDGIRYSDSRSTEHTLLTAIPFSTYESNSFDLRVGAGWMWEVGPVWINPEFTYRHPLTSSLAAPEEMKQRGITVTLGVLYRIR